MCDDLNYEYIRGIVGFDIDYKSGVAFIYDRKDNKLILGEEGEIHSDIRGKYNISASDMNRPNSRYIEGRYWFGKVNVISFWEYPKKSELDDFLKVFEEKTNLKIDDSWYIEVIITKTPFNLSHGTPQTDEEKIKEFKNKYNITDDFISDCRYYALIPIKKYLGSYKQREEDYKFHLMKQNDPRRKLRSKPEGFGSKKIKKYKDWQKPFESKLNESPDNISIKEDDSYFVNFAKYDIDFAKPIAFHPHTDELWVGDFFESHDKCPFIYDDIYRSSLRDVGRLWFNSKIDNEKGKELKVISFWKIPSPSRLEEIKNRLKDEKNIDISGWYLDFGKDGNYTILKDLDQFIQNGKQQEVDFSDDFENHTKSPLNKKKRIIPKGLGSKKIKKYKDWQKPFESINGNLNDLKGKNIHINYDTYNNDMNKNFWGNIGAGVLPISKETKKILLSYRSKFVNEPNTWGVWGGKLDDNENIESTVKREFIEETNYSKNIELISAYVFKTEGFEYHNFIGIVEEEFTPILNWETEDYLWVSFDELLNIEPKHFGLEKLLNDEYSINIIKKYTE
jgi:8-oxo-dGTP pyrophosphatase MutT (NUDIX family)